MSNAKELIVTKLKEADEMEDPRIQRARPPFPGGRPGGPRRGPGGPGEEPPGMFNRQERDALKAIVMWELLTMTGRDTFYKTLVETVLGNKDLEPAQIRHLLDEAGKFADLLSPEQRAVLDKLASLPQ